MIRKLYINNYKSIPDLTLEVGRFNVLIGENGCGKSNLLEAITLAAAAAADSLNNEFLVSRGIRITDPHLMRSAFMSDSSQEPIEINVFFVGLKEEEVDNIKYKLKNDNQPYSHWTKLGGSISEKKALLLLLAERNLELEIKLSEYSAKISKLMNKCTETGQDAIIDEDNLENKLQDITTLHSESKIKSTQITKSILDVEKFEAYEATLKDFIIYSPENTALRNFHKESQIEPLGINGEGLLKLLKVIQSKSPEQIQEIHTSLQLFDWYVELDIPKELSSAEDKVNITDRYLTLPFDQRSANEGFLFVLFYIALMVSDDTPKIFAIDNIDTSLNPKLCTKLIKELVRLSKKYDKQVFVTTHNPAILDGIDLGDDAQRLFVISRNKQGHTHLKRIDLADKPRSSSNEELKLSEAFLRGYVGGLPKGF